jgi:carbohydrate kinase (thermoresistant glucokinase family)
VRRWHAAGSAGIITCSALRREYRAIISGGGAYPVTFVYIKGSPQLIAGRLAGRLGHFMPAGLLDSQLATLEEPDPAEGALILDAALPPSDLADAIVRSVASRATNSTEAPGAQAKRGG